MGRRSTSSGRGAARRGGRLACITLGLLLSSGGYLDAQGRDYGGLYVGIELSRQRVYAGSLVEGVDVLAEVDRPVVQANLGGRVQFGPGIVLGAEVALGRFDGDLSARWNDTDVSWTGGGQRSLGVTVGWVIPTGPEPLLFAYAAEVSRDFDVALSGPWGTATQTDGQGFLRWGIGVEASLADRFGVRGTLGSGRADFGDATTSIEPGRPVELGVSVLYGSGSR